MTPMEALHILAPACVDCNRHLAMPHPPSPCTGICRIEPATGWCEGCKRTLGEIANWPMLSASDKRKILEQLPSRPNP